MHPGFLLQGFLDRAVLDRLPSGGDFLIEDLGAEARGASGGGLVHPGQALGGSQHGAGGWKTLGLPVAGQGGGQGGALGGEEGGQGQGELQSKQFGLDSTPALAGDEDLFSLLWQQVSTHSTTLCGLPSALRFPSLCPFA